jgi:DNA-binding PadR family transcriptional regulator
MTTIEYHVLLALANGALHGYAIKDAVAVESSGTLTPRAGSLYRVIARLISTRLVAETGKPGEAEPHPGLARRYYALTAGRATCTLAEAQRLRHTAAVAEKRLLEARGPLVRLVLPALLRLLPGRFRKRFERSCATTSSTTIAGLVLTDSSRPASSPSPLHPISFNRPSRSVGDPAFRASPRRGA